MSPRVLTLLAAALAPAVQAGSSSSFDMSWRYLLGDSTYNPPACDASGFTVNISGTQCMGMSETFGPTAEACQNSCCLDSACTIWQFDASNAAGPCWTGPDSGCTTNVSNAAWTSFQRPTPGPTPPPRAECTSATEPCAVGFDDSAWRTVNTPHDFVVEGAFSPNADRGHGYLP